MIHPPDGSLLVRVRASAGVAGLFAVLSGSLALAVWLLDFQVLRSLRSGLVAMDPLTAPCFVLAGLSLWLLCIEQVKPANQRRQQLAQICAGLVALVGLILFAAFLLGWDTRIDRRLFAEGSDANPMAPNAALSMLLVGSALLLLNLRRRSFIAAAQCLSLLALFVSLLALIGYAYGATFLYGVGSYIPMALPAAITFSVLSAGLLAARPTGGPIAVIFSEGPGGSVARRLLPAAIFIPLLLGGLRLLGEKAGLYDTAFGVSLFTVSTTVLFTAVIWWNAAYITQADRRRQQAEEALQQSASEIRELYDTAPCGYHSLDSRGTFIAINETELFWLGYVREEILGKKQFLDVLTPASQELFRKVFPTFKRQGWVKDVEFQLVRKNGTVFPVVLNAIAVKDAQGNYIASRATIFDITERKRAEEQRDRFFRLSLDLLCVAGFDGRMKQLNPAWKKMLGYEPEEIIAKPYLEFVHPDDRAATLAASAQLVSGGDIISFENRYRCKDGSYRWLLWSSTPLADQQLVYAVARDITERKGAEAKIQALNEDLQRRALQLEAANKELEAFSYSVSHDLRAPLRHIDGFVDLIGKTAGATLNEKTRRYLQIISDSAKQMGQLIDDLLVFSRMGRVEMQQLEVDLEALVQESIRGLEQETRGRRIDWKLECLPPVPGDPAMLRQVLTNLLANAVKYTRPRDPAQIEIGCLQEKADEVVIFVRDNGVGFDMQYVRKLFGVFQRLHRAEEFEGTGIGLANVRRIIQRHGGRTWGESKIDQGATFYFSLPTFPRGPGKINNETNE